VGTCGNDYCTQDDVAFILLGASASDSTPTVPTATQICNAIITAEKLINGRLHRAISYTTVPTPITEIAIKIVLNIIQVQKWWEVAEGATSDTDYQGSANYPADLINKIMTPEICKEIDEYKKLSKYYEADECNLIITTPQDDDLDFSRDEYV